jgi:hypothetical protein
MMWTPIRLVALVIAVAATGDTVSVARSSVEPEGVHHAVLHLTRPPYAAVHCPGANTIACDRVSIAAWPAGHPQGLTFMLAGRRVVMRLSRDGYWEGTLERAGLRRPGPLHITPDRGSAGWTGRHRRPIIVRLTAAYRDGRDATIVVHLLLRPGWG